MGEVGGGGINIIVQLTAVLIAGSMRRQPMKLFSLALPDLGTFFIAI